MARRPRRAGPRQRNRRQMRQHGHRHRPASFGPPAVRAPLGKMICQGCRVGHVEIARLAAGLFAVNIDVRQDHRHAERFRLLDRRAPAFEAGRIDECRWQPATARRRERAESSRDSGNSRQGRAPRPPPSAHRNNPVRADLPCCRRPQRRRRCPAASGSSERRPRPDGSCAARTDSADKKSFGASHIGDDSQRDRRSSSAGCRLACKPHHRSVGRQARDKMRWTIAHGAFAAEHDVCGPMRSARESRSRDAIARQVKTAAAAGDAANPETMPPPERQTPAKKTRASKTTSMRFGSKLGYRRPVEAQSERNRKRQRRCDRKQRDRTTSTPGIRDSASRSSASSPFPANTTGAIFAGRCRSSAANRLRW